jgi:DNA-binding response OmpR family regulator
MPPVSRPTILVIEDEADIRQVLRLNLAAEGYRMVCHEDGESGLVAAEAEPPDLVILDLMLPGIDGLEVCRRLRANPRLADCAVIMLTAKARETDTVLGLGFGADDYIAKPFRVAELIARVQAVLRRRLQPPRSEAPAVLDFGPLALQREQHALLVDGTPERLTASEYKLLEQLMGAPQRVFSRQLLIAAVNGREMHLSERTVDTHLNSIRRKFGPYRKCIETVWGVGYCFHPPAAAEEAQQ